MDAIWIRILGAGEWGLANKEFIMLFMIFLANMKLQHRMKLQKVECSGDFKVVNEKLLTVVRTADKADIKATEAINAVNSIKPKVDELHKHFLDDKFKNIQEVR